MPVVPPTPSTPDATQELDNLKGYTLRPTRTNEVAERLRIALEKVAKVPSAKEKEQMKSSLNEGFTAEATHRVTEEMSPQHLDVNVLSTPSMVQLIETTCIEAIIPHLEEGETSVGTHVNVSHKGPASAGEDVVVKVVLSKIDRRRLTFTTTVQSPAGLISDGTHERAVVDASRFG